MTPRKPNTAVASGEQPFPEDVHKPLFEKYAKDPRIMGKASFDLSQSADDGFKAFTVLDLGTRRLMDRKVPALLAHTMNLMNQEPMTWFKWVWLRQWWVFSSASKTIGLRGDNLKIVHAMMGGPKALEFCTAMIAAMGVTAAELAPALARKNPSTQEQLDKKQLRGLDPTTQYTMLRWGLTPKRTSSVKSTNAVEQQLVELGRLAALHLVDSAGEPIGTLIPEKPLPALAVGSVDNRLYIVGGSAETMAKKHGWRINYDGPVFIRQTDYYAKKGRNAKVVYWYHEHEKPYPRYTVKTSGLPHFSGGKYFVHSAGIVG